MKYQALRPHFFSMVGGWRVLGVGGWHWGWWVGGVVMLWVPMMPPMLVFDNLVKNLTKCQKNNMGASWGASDAPHNTPMLFFGNLVKKLDNLSL